MMNLKKAAISIMIVLDLCFSSCSGNMQNSSLISAGPGAGAEGAVAQNGAAAPENAAFAGETAETPEAKEYDDFKKECLETDYYKGIDRFIQNFDLADYKCIYIGPKAVVWIPVSQAPQSYADVVKKTEPAIGTLEKFFNSSICNNYRNEEKVNFFYGSTDITFTPCADYDKPVVFAPSSGNRYCFQSYMHELVHIMTIGFPPGSTWSNEGMAVYLNDYLGGSGNFPNYGEDIDNVSAGLLNRNDIIEKIGDKNFYITQADLSTSFGSGYYTMCGSFVKFIIEKIGFEKFMKAYKSVDFEASVMEETGKGLDKWKTEWLSRLEEINGKKGNQASVDPNRDSPWTKKKSMPEKLIVTGAFAVDNLIYVLAGDNYASNSNVLYSFEPSTDTWTKKSSSLPEEGYGGLAVAIGSDIYTFGGYYIESMDKWHKTGGIQKYDPSSDKWAVETTLPDGFDALGAAPYKDKIYIFGSSGTLVYDPKTKSHVKADPPCRPDCQAAFAFNDRIYALFGQFENLLYKYDPDTGKWTYKAKMLLPRIHLTPAVIGGKFYAIGGIASDELVRNNVEQYDIKTNKFTSCEAAPYGFWSAGVAAFNGKVYLMGGVTDSGFENFTDAVYEYNPSLDKNNAPAPLSSENSAEEEK